MKPLFPNVPRKPVDKLAGIDIQAEYKLILQKKSKLSANMRALVVQQVEGK